MTIKRKVTKADGSEEVVDQVIPGPWGKIISGLGGYRVLLIVLIASQHPVGRQLLGTFGFEFPDQRKLTVATEEAKGAKDQLTGMAVSINDIKADVASLKANNAIINEKVDRLDKTFTGFQVDFNKWKPQTKPE